MLSFSITSSLPDMKLGFFRKKLQNNIDDIMKSLGGLSDKYYSDISAIREALEIEVKKYGENHMGLFPVAYDPYLFHLNGPE